ncbi:MAG: Ig-like domain-containing protein [Terriglobales bacterium]
MVLCKSLGRALFGSVLFVAALAVSAGWSQSITTYHYDNNRTGWNQNETTLTPSNVNSSSFAVVESVPLDDQVDAQPLYMPGVNITAGSYPGTHNVVYVATENNTVFAIDAQSGTILLSANFGTPVPRPLGCNNNGPNVGITSTPVIDASTNTLYVMVYTRESGTPEYMLHALHLGSLTDKVSPQQVSSSHTLTDGSTFQFNATYERQRPGLLLANGNIYAGFGSFCDEAANVSRGWLLGWEAGTLTPLAANDLFDFQATSPNSFFLSSIWMSGYAPATDDSGNVLVVTGNSDYSGTTYDGTTNIQESALKISSDLSTVLDLFTPADWPSLDQNDGDFGSGGIMVLPDQPGAYPHLAVAAGKDGNLYFMNEDSLGGYSSSGNNVLGTYYIGGCWCGPSYYVDPSDSLPRVVTSGGSNVQVYQVLTSPSPSLNQVSQSTTVPNGANGGGFFTSISSNGTSNAIIWALSRSRSSATGNVHLFAFNPDSGSTLRPIYNESAGTWKYPTGNSNLVPVVANGEVFVASYKQLNIFGLTKAVTSTILSSATNPANYGQAVTLSAQVSSTVSGTPTGTVTFNDGSKMLGTATLSGGTAVLSITGLSLGSNSLTATYNGDSSNSGSQGTFTEAVNPATIRLTLSSGPNPSQSGKLVKFTATLTSNASLPKGQPVIFGYNGAQLGKANVSAAGTASFSTKTLPVGTDTVTATYSGSTDYSAATGSAQQTVN